jgi:hypothetical protein
VRAYKVLSNGRSEFTGVRWPLPVGRTPGEWLSASGTPQLCVNGIHACTVDQLPQWLGAELWEIELGGEVVTTEAALVASRARLVQRVSRWDDDAQKRFARDCSERAHASADVYAAGAELVAMIERFVEGGLAAAAGYWTALLAGESATGRRAGTDYDAAFARERAAQARWLAEELGLAQRH